MYISKVTIRNFRIFDQVGITASFKKELMRLSAKTTVARVLLLMLCESHSPLPLIKKTSILT